MKESQHIDGVIETVITDEALHLTHKAEEPEEMPVHPAVMKKSIMTAYNRAKKASVEQNDRARRIVTEMRDKREINTIDDVDSAMCGQTTIFEFG